MKISKDKALELIDQRIQEFEKVLARATYRNRYDEAYRLAYEGTEGLLTDLFSAKETRTFRRNLMKRVAFSGTGSAEQLRDYKENIKRCIAQLKIYRERISSSWEVDGERIKAQTETGVLTILESVFSHFHRVAIQLRKRHGSRLTLDVRDEYDVQDLLHALLRLYFDDIRPEEWTPSYASGSSKMDFLLKKEQVVV
jgi:hypothetical protein